MLITLKYKSYKEQKFEYCSSLKVPFPFYVKSEAVKLVLCQNKEKH